MNRRPTGRRGEDAAALYLVEQGYTVLARNLYIGHDEIDIVAKNGTHLVFAEVKTRHAAPDRPDGFGPPAAAVDRHKQLCLLRAAQAFLRNSGTEYSALIPNIDVIEVYLAPRSEQVLAVRHYKNAVRG